MRHTLVLSALLGTGLLAATSAAQAAGGSLVFCSEGSPAGFDTAQYTTATDNDAAEPLYNRLAEFEKGATNVCLLYTSPSPRDRQKSRMPSSA